MKADLISDPAVSTGVPRHQILHQSLDPATIPGAEVLPRQSHVPVRAGAQHGQEWHEMTGSIHRELCRGGGTPERRPGKRWSQLKIKEGLYTNIVPLTRSLCHVSFARHNLLESMQMVINQTNCPDNKPSPKQLLPIERSRLHVWRCYLDLLINTY